jgi:hypothetical protein
VTTLGDVPDKAGREMTVGARPRFSALDRAFRYQKAASKSLYQAHIRGLDQEINRLRWSDPSLEYPQGLD